MTKITSLINLSLSLSAARRTLSFILVAHVVGQYILWVFFALVFILFSVGFVQLVSIHAIGKTRACVTVSVIECCLHMYMCVCCANQTIICTFIYALQYWITGMASVVMVIAG